MSPARTDPTPLTNRPAVTSSIVEGVSRVLVTHGGITEMFLTVLPGFGEAPDALSNRIRAVVDEIGCELLEIRVFSGLGGATAVARAMRHVPEWVEVPLSCIEGGGCHGHEIAGIQVHAVRGSPVGTVRRQGMAVGRSFEDAFARYCVFGGLRPPETGEDRAVQARDTLAGLMEGLGAAGMDIQNVVRTWFYLADILDWYPAFNAARSEVYRAGGVFERYVPASTGIGGYNPEGAALVASAVAMAPTSEGVAVRAIPSPLQCSALSYGSSFSRAAELVTPDVRFVFVSGTASIDGEGHTVHRGDVDAQIARTLETVGAILGSKEMTYGDVTRGNAYFKDPRDASRLEVLAARYDVPLDRILPSHNDVCRGDLLFELEVDAVKATGETGAEEAGTEATDPR